MSFVKLAKSSSDQLLRVVRPTPCFTQGHDCLQLCGQATLPLTPHNHPQIPLIRHPNCTPHSLVAMDAPNKYAIHFKTLHPSVQNIISLTSLNNKLV